jgi:hypothetical protein
VAACFRFLMRPTSPIAHYPPRTRRPSHLHPHSTSRLTPPPPIPSLDSLPPRHPPLAGPVPSRPPHQQHAHAARLAAQPRVLHHGLPVPGPDPAHPSCGAPLLCGAGRARCHLAVERSFQPREPAFYSWMASILGRVGCSLLLSHRLPAQREDRDAPPAPAPPLSTTPCSRFPILIHRPSRLVAAQSPLSRPPPPPPQVLSDFSILINEFEALSSFSAGLSRLSTFVARLESCAAAGVGGGVQLGLKRVGSLV